MFTGIIEAVGTVRTAERDGPGLVLTLEAPWTDVAPGESVAVDGACLTATEVGDRWFRVNTVATSLDRTLFAQYQTGRPVNLERALRLGDRLGGHLVQGHVDGIGRVIAATDREDARVVDLEVPPEVARVSIPMGSVTVDGVSLTVIALPAPGQVRISLIPFTLQHTTLSRLAPGVLVHVEGDVIGRYVERMMAGR